MPTARPVSYSALERQVYEIFPNNLNPHGTAFGGYVAELIDRVAMIVSQKHCGSDCATLSYDRLHFLAPARLGEKLVFKAAVNRVWTTSMEVGIKVFAENWQTDESRHVVSAYVTCVAVDAGHRPMTAPPVLPETPDEVRRYEEADERRQRRLAEAASRKK